MVSLSFVDMAFFLLETGARPMNVGALTVIAPPAGMRRGFADKLVQRMLRRPVGPPFDHRLRPGTLLPELVLDPDIDPKAQLRRVRLRPGATLAQLFAAVCRLHSQLLPRDEPLWQAHVFEGLADGKVAIYFKTHHGIIDGLGFIEAYTASVAMSARSRSVRAVWEGIPGAARPAPRPRAWTESLQAVLADTVGKARAANDFGRLLLHGGLRRAGLGHGLVLPFVATPESFKARPSTARSMGHVALPLARIRAIGKAQQATVNDVLLTVLDLAMRHYLESHAATPAMPLVADMPVALGGTAGTGNRITILQLPLGQGGLTPTERLAAVKRETTEVKQQLRELSGDALVLYSMLVHGAASAIEALGLRQLPMLANAVISNPYGVEARAYCMGAPIELCLPVSVVAHHQTLNITATTYVDELHVTCIGVREALPDIQRLADGTLAALAELERDLATPGSRRPRRQRARAR